MTPTDTPADTARHFRSLHERGRPLVLPNAWDVASARLVEHTGAAAVATTSAGVSWGVGVPDGERLDRDRALDLIARVVAAVRAPVTADVESGYAEKPADVAETVRGVLAAGAVGVNLEDADHGGPGPLRSVAAQSERIAVARQAADAEGVPLFINARVDTYLSAVGEAGDRLASTLDRARAYVGAGADGIFVPGVTDPVIVSALVDGIDVPVNVMTGPGAPAIAELAGLGVARISVGSAIAQAAYAVVRRSAQELLSAGTYAALSDALDFADVNALLRTDC
ncbi:isocitrate lyase/phosphoenolpyruvate mutase family protein [Actinopolymorpha sp. B11F2]|uniref:isocitrate lyase/PEP mutase family protein n=1 Tax=Actinopolymorpha sp. B11F2 TaxID=3160862 RepID=UPI0032E46CE9